ncbi:hypothetical protein BH09BAC6_BH09BAC6_35290 [soil metagenome]|jgi:hypothetical protein
MKKRLFAIFIAGLCCSFHIENNTLKGVWEYQGDVSNGKKEGAPTDYSLQRRYTDSTYAGFIVEKGVKPEKYEGGNYKLKNDTCLETQTYSLQPSTQVGKTIQYLYTIHNDTLTLKGILANGTAVEEYWKRVSSKPKAKQ